MDIQQIFSYKVSYQSAIWKPIESQISILETVQQILSAEYLDQILSMRELLSKGDLEGYAEEKRKLPAVTFCGTFDKIRKKENLISYNNLIVLDIDNLMSSAELSRVDKVLMNDSYVIMYWKSPSGRGFKGLVALDYQFEWDKAMVEKVHKYAFRQLRFYFESKHQILLDESGSDLTRLCFMSDDPEIFFNIQKGVVCFPVNGFVPGNTTNTMNADPGDAANVDRVLPVKDQPREMHSIEKIIDYLQKTDQSITESYDCWYRVAFALCEAFTFKVGQEYFLALSKQDGPKYDEEACRNLYYYCYNNASGRIKLNTIMYYAKGLGYQPSSDHLQKLDKSDEQNV